MKIQYLQKPTQKWTERIPKSKEYPRHWITIVDIEVELSDDYILKIPEGTIWDGASIPKWLWWLLKPIDEGAIGDLIHDELWKDKKAQLAYFGYNIYLARKFADDERKKWRKALAPDKKIKNWITHRVIRLIGGFFYSRQLQIPS
jgi:hypothetical protein